MICQPLAFRALNRAMRALGIVHAKARAVRIAEIEFAQIRLQMLFSAVVVHAAHPAFEYAEKAFYGVRRRLAARIFAVAVIDRLMSGKRLAGL